MVIRKVGQIFCSFILLFFCEPSFAGSIRDKIEDRGYLRCGIENIKPFLSKTNPLERAATEYCHAMALALFRDKSAIKITRIPNGKNTSYLNNNTVDLVMLAGKDRGDLHQKTVLSAPLLINGMKVLSVKGNDVVQRLNGQRVCTFNNKTNNQGLAVFSQKHQISFSVVSYDTPEQLLKMSLEYKCKAVALPHIHLLKFQQKIKRFFPLSKIIESTNANHRLGIVVSGLDQEWIDITSAFGYALLEAEIENITSKNIDLIASTSTIKTVQFLLGLKGNHALSLGLDKQWAYRVIKTHGNYNEIYQRHFGETSSFPIERAPISLLLNDRVYKKSYFE